MHITSIIPARYASSRLPGKPLALIGGIPMIQHVYQQVKKVKQIQEIIVASDDQRIANVVIGFGGQVILTSSDHQNGTERCAEVVQNRSDIDLVINIQGDEPFIAPEQIELLIEQLILQKSGIATLAKQLDNEADWLNPNIVKVLFNTNREVLYFSRAPLPFHRDHQNHSWDISQSYYKHFGLYGYYRDALLEIAQLPPSPLEQAESLEQLRWLENGYRIGIALTEVETIAVDTPEDLVAANKWMSDH